MAAETAAKVCLSEAMTPDGGSKMKTREDRTRLPGTFGVNSMVRKRRNSACGVRPCSCFSRPTSLQGRKATAVS